MPCESEGEKSPAGRKTDHAKDARWNRRGAGMRGPASLQTANALASAMTFTANPVTAVYCQAVVLTANVSPVWAPAGFAPLNGEVTFLLQTGFLVGQGT